MTTHPHSEIVLAMLDAGEWTLTRTLPDPSMTDAYLARTAWCVGRQVAPFCDSKDMRTWFGPTAHAALVAAHTALFGDSKPLPAPAGQGMLMETQLGLFFAVAQTGGDDDELCSQRQTRSYNALTAIILDRGLAELGRHADGFSYLPVSLCECDWDGQELDGQVVYGVFFHSDGEIDPARASKLRDMALEAYTKVCGADAHFIRAELYQKFARSTRSPYTFEPGKPVHA